jgi:hypothetical protein
MYLLGNTPALQSPKGNRYSNQRYFKFWPDATHTQKTNKERRTLKSAFLWKCMFQSWSSARKFCSRFKWQIDLCTYQEDQSPKKTLNVFHLLGWYAVWSGRCLPTFRNTPLYSGSKKPTKHNGLYSLRLKMDAFRSTESSVTRLHEVKSLFMKNLSHDSRSHRAIWFMW